MSRPDDPSISRSWRPGPRSDHPEVLSLEVLRSVVAPKRGLILDHSRRQRHTALDHINLLATREIEFETLCARRAAGKKVEP